MNVMQKLYQYQSNSLVVGSPLTLNCGFLAMQTYLPLSTLPFGSNSSLSPTFFSILFIKLLLLLAFLLPFPFVLPVTLPNSSNNFLLFFLLSRISSIGFPLLLLRLLPLALISLYWFIVNYGNNCCFLRCFGLRYRYYKDYVGCIFYLWRILGLSGSLFIFAYIEFSRYSIVQNLDLSNTGCKSRLLCKCDLALSFRYMYFCDEFLDIQYPRMSDAYLFLIMGLNTLSSRLTLLKANPQGLTQLTCGFSSEYSTVKNDLLKNLLEVIISQNILKSLTKITSSHNQHNHICSVQFKFNDNLFFALEQYFIYRK